MVEAKGGGVAVKVLGELRRHPADRQRQILDGRIRTMDIYMRGTGNEELSRQCWH